MSAKYEVSGHKVSCWFIWNLRWISSPFEIISDRAVGSTTHLSPSCQAPRAFQELRRPKACYLKSHSLWNRKSGYNLVSMGQLETERVGNSMWISRWRRCCGLYRRRCTSIWGANWWCCFSSLNGRVFVLNILQDAAIISYNICCIAFIALELFFEFSATCHYSSEELFDET